MDIPTLCLQRTAYLLVLVIVFFSLSWPTGRALAAKPTVAVEPCSLLTLEEVGAVVHGTATQDRPHVVAINNVPVGGDCAYRSAQNKLIVINLHVDAYPGGHQQKAFENARRLPHVTDLPGLGDRAFTVTNPNGPPGVTFLRGMVLVTIMAQGLSVDQAKQLATRAASRLPTATGKSPAPLDHVKSSPMPQSRSVPPSPPASHGNGTLDPALIGSWFLTQPNGRGLGQMYIKPDGTFSMALANKRRGDRPGGARGTIDGENGVLHLHPTDGGHVQELRYRIVNQNRMEWIDQRGAATIANRLPH